MDLQSFCVVNRRKNNSFPFFKSTINSMENMSKSFEFGVPVSEHIMEDNCFKNIPNITYNTHFTYPSMAKQEFQSKKSCFDHLSKLSHLSFSRVVGGFVGSKSQGGSASREPHQVWDVVLRQLVNSDCYTPINNNAQQYFSFGEPISESIFGQFNNRKGSTLNFTPFLFAQSCELLANQRTSGNMQGLNGNQCSEINSGQTNAKEQVCLQNYRSDSPTTQTENVEDLKPQMAQCTSKQSYAEVAKSSMFVKPESSAKSERSVNMPPTIFHRNTRVNPQYLRKDREKFTWRKKQYRSYAQLVENNSSQKPSVTHDKFEDPLLSKSTRSKVDYMRHCKAEMANPHKVRSKDSNISHICSKATERPRFNKFRNYNTREKERKNIDHQVHEDTVFSCDQPQQLCQNWRCNHNRLLTEHGSTFESGIQSKVTRAPNFKPQSRLHSPPPRTLMANCMKMNKPKTEEKSLKKEANDSSKSVKMADEMLHNSIKSTSLTVLDFSGSGESSCESLVSFRPNSPGVWSGRPRVASECSVDSEDSSVIFERDECDLVETESNPVDDSGSSSECDSDGDCDEVDFCFVLPSDEITSNGDGFADPFCPVSNRLKDVNAKWHKENRVLPEHSRIPKKVRFTSPEKLTKVHYMIHWLYAYRVARRGPWEEIGRDRCRFRMRIERAEQDLSFILSPEHRNRIWKERMSEVDSM